MRLYSYQHSSVPYIKPEWLVAYKILPTKQMLEENAELLKSLSFPYEITL